MHDNSKIIREDIVGNFEEKYNRPKVIKEEIVESFEKALEFKKMSLFRKIYLKFKFAFIDSRYKVKCFFQKIKYGFKCEESWSFYRFHSEWSAKRLIHMKENLKGHPATLENIQQWESILEKIIWSFQNIDQYPMPVKPKDFDERIKKTTYEDGSIGLENIDKRGSCYKNVEAFEERINEGLELFAKYYSDLWD
jgi:hypothetical protein